MGQRQQEAQKEAQREAKTYDVLVGRNIKAARLTRGLSQEQLATALGVTFQQVQKYENASNRISAGRLVQLARVCGVPLDRLFLGMPGTRGSNDAEHAMLLAEMARNQRSLKAIGALPGPVQTRLRLLAEAMTAALRAAQR